MQQQRSPFRLDYLAPHESDALGVGAMGVNPSVYQQMTGPWSNFVSTYASPSNPMWDPQTGRWYNSGTAGVGTTETNRFNFSAGGGPSGGAPAGTTTGATTGATTGGTLTGTVGPAANTASTAGGFGQWWGKYGDAINLGVGLLSGIFQAKGAKDQAAAQNAFLAWLYDPARIAAAGKELDPYSWNILESVGKGQDPWAQQKLLDAPLTALERGYDTNLRRVESMIGRSGMQGGLANAFALSNQAGRTNARANLYNQYELWKQEQVKWHLGQLANAQARAAGLAGQQGSGYQQPPNWWQTAGNALQGWLSAYGTLNQRRDDDRPPGVGQYPSSTTQLGPPPNWYNQHGTRFWY